MEMLTGTKSVMGRWKEHFKELMNYENEREKILKQVTLVDQKVAKISKADVRRALKRMQSGKAVGSEEEKCAGADFIQQGRHPELWQEE